MNLKGKALKVAAMRVKIPWSVIYVVGNSLWKQKETSYEIPPKYDISVSMWVHVSGLHIHVYSSAIRSQA